MEDLSKVSSVSESIDASKVLRNEHDNFTNLNEDIKLKDVVIVMDKHPAHCIETELLLQEMGSIVLKLPPSTSFFNPVEMCWAWIKNRWRNTLLQ
jgi:transposase